MDAKRGRFTLGVGLACLVSVIVIIMSLGVSLPASPFEKVELSGPIICDTDGEATVIVDSEASRALLLDKSYRLTRIVNLDLTNSPMESITDAIVSSGRAYLAGVSYHGDSSLISRETIASYGLFHAPYEVLTEYSDESRYDPFIKSLTEAPNSIYVTTVENASDEAAEEALVSLVVHEFAPDGTHQEAFRSEKMDVDVFSAGYDESTSTVVTVSQRGLINDGLGEDEDNPLSDYAFTDIDVGADGNYYATDDYTGAVYRIDPDTAELTPIITNTRYNALSVNGNRVSACSLSNNAVVLADLDGHIERTLKSVELSWPLSLFVLVVWLSWAVLAISVAGYLIHRIRLALATSESGALGTILTISAVAFAVGVCIYTNVSYTYEQTLDTRMREIQAFAGTLEYYAEDVSESMEAISDRSLFRSTGAEYKEAVDNLVTVIDVPTSIAWPADVNGIGTYYTVYGTDDKGPYVAYSSESQQAMGSSNMTPEMKRTIADLFANYDDSGEVHFGATARDATIYRFVDIPTSDGKGTAGIIEFGSHMGTFATSVMNDLMENAVRMLVVLFVIYIVYAELRGCGRVLLTYVQLKDGDTKRDAIALLTRPYTFIVSTLIACDSVMSTLIARSMITGDGAAVLIALPAAFAGVGLVLGQLVYGSLASRWGVRRIVCSFAALMMAAAGVAILAVSRLNFALYVAMKLVLGISFGLLYTLGYSLPRQASQSDLQLEASGGVRRTDTSAAALGTITGGYMAQIFGNDAVYVLLVVGGLVLILFARLLFLSMKHPLEGKPLGFKKRWQRTKELYATKELASLIVFIMFPIVLAMGYNSFVFPLYCADLGLSSSAISRMCVLGQLVVYVLIDGIEYVTDRYGKWRVELASVSLIGITFLLLNLNAVFTLALVTIVLVGVFCKASDAWKGLWMRQAELVGTHLGQATGLMYATRSALLIIQPLILSFLVKWPPRVPPLVVGICALVGVSCFFLATRKSKLSEA